VLLHDREGRGAAGAGGRLAVDRRRGAKVYDRSCGLGPWIVLGCTEQEARGWTVSIAIDRSGREVFFGRTRIDQIKRSFGELVGYLWRSQSFPHGVVLLTGTGVVPDESFTRAMGDPG
jgi:2-dehydro-3-deoxy-D-arabinonate dehydratase